jgi:hypothetical protein
MNDPRNKDTDNNNQGTDQNTEKDKIVIPAPNKC